MKIPTTPQRSRMMASIRSKNTKPEKSLRALLFAKGFRYRLHVRNLPGSPDLVLPRYRAAIFVHGCFWHRHVGCPLTTTPKNNQDFWLNKFQGNVERDARHVESLTSLGWRVAIVWECALRLSAEDSANRVSDWLSGDQHALVIGSRDGHPISEK